MSAPSTPKKPKKKGSDTKHTKTVGEYWVASELARPSTADTP